MVEVLRIVKKHGSHSKTHGTARKGKLLSNQPTTNQHFIKSNSNDRINMMTAMNCLHLLTHHDIDHFHHYFANDQETKKKV